MTITFDLLILTLAFASLRPRAPIEIIHCSVFQQCSKDKDETHHQIDIDRFDVGDAGQRRTNTGGDRRHRQNSGDTWTATREKSPRGRSSFCSLTECHTSTGCFMIDPEAHPGEHHNENRRQIGLKEKIADVALKNETQRQTLIDT